MSDEQTLNGAATASVSASATVSVTAIERQQPVQQLPQSQEWTIQKILAWATSRFASKNISSARLDAELLLADALGCRRLDLHLKFDKPLSDEELKRFKKSVVRRDQREPVAYILGRQEFYGRDFKVGPGVLIPRPETEHLVDEALAWAKTQATQDFQIIDVGSGSGCIAVTLAAELTQAQVAAIDKAPTGVSFTTENAASLGVAERVNVVGADFSEIPLSLVELSSSSDAETVADAGADAAAAETITKSCMDNFTLRESFFDIVVSNPPYISIKEKENLQPEVGRYEPAEALFGGEAGDEILLAWIPKMTKLLKPGGILLCEFGFDQGEKIQALAQQETPLTNIQIIRDYSGHQRLLKAIKVSNNNG